MDDVLVTIERFVLDHQPQEARGELTAILYDMALAAKMIASQTRRAGLIDILGYTDDINVQGEQQKKLDVYADEVIFDFAVLENNDGGNGSDLKLRGECSGFVDIDFSDSDFSGVFIGNLIQKRS